MAHGAGCVRVHRREEGRLWAPGGAKAGLLPLQLYLKVHTLQWALWTRPGFCPFSLQTSVPVLPSAEAWEGPLAKWSQGAH